MIGIARIDQILNVCVPILKIGAHVFPPIRLFSDTGHTLTLHALNFFPYRNLYLYLFMYIVNFKR